MTERREELQRDMIGITDIKTWIQLDVSFSGQSETGSCAFRTVLWLMWFGMALPASTAQVRTEPGSRSDSKHRRRLSDCDYMKCIRELNIRNDRSEDPHLRILGQVNVNFVREF